jgi:NADH-quinone oxidoreductase subunit E
MLDMPHIRMLEIATFYTMFQLSPVGKKAHVQVCGTTPCKLRGAADLIDVCQHRIHHDPFHLSADGDFSWEEVECLGACVNAPMVMIWKDTYEDLTKDSFGKVLDSFAAGNPPKPGPQIDRQFAAPVGGPRVLKDGGGPAAAGPGAAKEPVLADAEPKKQTESANFQERPAPKPPADDATRKGNV